MTSDLRATFLSSGPDDTASLAIRLAPEMRPGDTVLLNGEIGAGKSHFARALINERLRVAGLCEDIPSPTFTLVQTYDDRKTEIWHADLYRINDPFEIIELGLLDAFDTAICLIEWPAHMGKLKPKNALTIDFKIESNEQTRRLDFRATDSKWAYLFSTRHPLQDQC